MSETYEQISTTMDGNLSNVQAYVQNLQNYNGIDGQHENPEIQKLGEIVKCLNEELHQQVDATLADMGGHGGRKTGAESGFLDD